MARIRTIKPEFWSDEKMAQCGPVVRLVFLGLISMADDYGRLIDNEKQIEAFIFPFSDASTEIRETLATLERLSRIRRGEAENGQKVIEIVHWGRHQKVDKPGTRGLVPQIVACQELVCSPESLARLSGDSREALQTDLGSKEPGPSIQFSATTARELFLSSILDTGKRGGWVATLNGWAEGMGTPGMKPFTVEQIDAGLAEYLANESAPTFAARHVIRYVEGVASRKPNEPTPKPRRAFGETGFLASVIAEEAEKRRQAEEVAK